MRAIICLLAVCLGMVSLQAKTITDMAGRQVEIPDKMERIFPYDAKISIFIYPLLKDKMVATSILPGKKHYRFIAKEYAELPQVDVKNIEEVLSISPQVIIYGVYDKNDNTGPVLTLGKRLNIPVLFIDLSINELDKSYRFLGNVFSKKNESHVYVSYLQDIYQYIDSLKKASPPVKGSAYYSLGPSGLLTDPSGSKHTEVFDYLEIPIAAKVEIPSGGHAKVNMEQVLMWNPGYIFTSDFRGSASAYNDITTDSKWKSIKAVQENRVYRVPVQPLSWFDHPPSINRIPGAIWLCEIFYNQSKEQTMKVIQQFYRLFYGYTLSSEEYGILFN